MSRKQGPLLLLLFLVLATGSAFLWLAGDGGEAGPGTVEVAAPVTVRSDTPPRRVEPTEPVLVLPERVHDGPVTTVVEHPLQVELTLLQRGSFPDARELLPPGTGANARLRGRIAGDRGEPDTGAVTFLAGPNAGRVLTTDGQGRFGASDLYQGLSIVEIESDHGLRSVRRVELRQLGTSELNVTLGRAVACRVYGIVRERGGEGILGAEVELDGGRARTDGEGNFHFPRVSPGVVLCVVRKPGYAAYQQFVSVPRAGVITKENLVLTLDRGANLELRLENAIGGPGPAYAFVLPVGGQRVNERLGQDTFPWHEINPVELRAGGTKLIEGLQPGHVMLTVFHPGAIASPPFETKKLQGGRENHHAFRLRKGTTIRGVVQDEDGQPVAGARVILEAPDRGIATTKVLQQKPTFNLTMVLPHLPASLQEVTTDSRGQFVLTAFPLVSSGYYLTASDPSGKRRASRTVTAVESEIELTLAPVQDETASVHVRMGGRFQGLPVELTVNGASRDPFVLAAEEELEITELEPGTWRAEIWWHHERLTNSVPFTLVPKGLHELPVALPTPALEGPPVAEQTEEDPDS